MGDVNLFENEQFGGATASINGESKDLTDVLPNGASSMKVLAKEWNVFTKKSYNGTAGTVLPGREYATLASMGLSSPVMSMRPK